MRANDLLALTTLCFVSAEAQAYPISPVPLWPLTAKATHIVVAKVEKVEGIPDGPSRESFDSDIATLLVLQTLKGPRLDQIEVPYPRGLMCPAPPVYRVGETVVAFLQRREDSAFSTVALSYGTLYPRGGELADMEAMVRLAVFIQGAGLDEAELEEHKRDWLVRAAALPSTRWHGLYELAPASDRIRSYYDHSGREGRIRVDPEGQKLLAEAFLVTEKADPTLSMLLAVIAAYEDRNVDRAAIGWVEGILALEKPPWWTRDLIEETLKRLGDPSTATRFEKLEGRNWPGTPEDWRRLWEEAKRDLGIPDVEPHEVVFQEYLPVGGRTPS